MLCCVLSSAPLIRHSAIKHAQETGTLSVNSLFSNKQKIEKTDDRKIIGIFRMFLAADY
jgi:hypothetical protein